MAVALVALAGCGGSSDGSPGQTCVGAGDGCKATLQEALVSAKAGATITLPAAQLTGPVVIRKSATLVGRGVGRTVISGGGPVVTIGRGLTVAISGVTITGGVSSADPVRGCGADIPDCGPGYPKATALGGGMEIAERARVTIRSSAVTGNRAVPSRSVESVTATCGDRACAFAQGGGGGVDNWGALTLVDTTVSDNTAGGGVTAQADGGGILSEAGSKLVVDNSTVRGNHVVAAAPNGRLASGGGVFVDAGGSLVMTGSRVTANRAETTTAMPAGVDVTANAGGVFLGSETKAVIRRSAVSGNVVAESNTTGNGVACAGGISTTGSSLHLADSTLSGNRVSATARRASSKAGDLLACSGAIDLFADTAEITGTSFIGNSVRATTESGTALSVAGVMSAVAGTQTSIDDSVLKGNSATAVSRTGTATVDGGAFHNAHTTYLTGVRITGNRAVARAPHAHARGGGIFNGLAPDLDPADVHLETKHTTVMNNTPDQCHGCQR